MTVPKSHPRYMSLKTRDTLVEGWKKGLVATQGLIAHGRGEAFDYLLGEGTLPFAEKSERTAAALLLLADHPVLSVNGNVGALVPDGISKLSGLLECPVEVNIFHRTEDRVRRLVTHLEEAGCGYVLGEDPDHLLQGLDHPRALCSGRGIGAADVVLVPLEDGDRCEILKKAGKKVITIDLNPLSRTAKKADITIVDNVIRAIPKMVSFVEELGPKRGSGEMGKDELRRIVKDYDNESILSKTVEEMVRNHIHEGAM